MWWILALIAALAQTGRNAIMKDIGDRLDEYINVWGRFIFLLPFALAITLYIGIPELKEGFWFASFMAGLTTTLSTLLLSKAFKYGHISFSIAIWKISTIGFLILGVLFLNEEPTLIGIIGILIVLIGVYLLNIEKAQASYLAPITALFTEKGPRYALLSGIAVSFTMYYFKEASLLSSGSFSGFMNHAFAALMMTPIVLAKSRNHLKIIPSHLLHFSSMGVLAAISTVFSNIAYVLTVGAYVEGVKQIELLFALAIGIIFFREKNIVKRIWPGCLIIIAGTCILIFQ